MKLLRILLLFPLMLITVVVPAHPALAGGWAVTVLDPVPERFEAGRSYTIGYWVLQHGFHPYDGELATGLRLHGPDGKELTFQGVPLREPAHYAAAVSVPRGEWRVLALQGIFGEHEVGTLTVPGVLEVRPYEGEARHSHGDGSEARPVAASELAAERSLWPTITVSSGAAALLLACLVLAIRRRRTSA